MSDLFWDGSHPKRVEENDSHRMAAALLLERVGVRLWRPSGQSDAKKLVPASDNSWPLVVIQKNDRL